MIGKEIVRFHCVFWPAFLMAAGLPLPRSLFAHGWLLFEDSKMSKSRGNVVRAETVVDVLGNDALRYFLLREVVFGHDGSFSFDALVHRYNSDLANDLGNLSSRTLTMVARYFDGAVPAAGKPSPAERAVAKSATKVIKEFRSHFEQFEFSRALESAWSLVGAVNKYLVEAEPWALAEKPDKPSRARLATVLYTAAEALRVVTALAHPAMPESTARIWKQMGLGDIAKVRLDRLAWGQLKAKTRLGKVEGVFPRADKSAIERMQKMEEERPTNAPTAPQKSEPPAASAAPALSSAKPAAPAASDGKISIDDFAKVEMRVGQVKVAEKVQGADRLLRLEVDIGTEVRQVVAGIAESYAPESLVGRKVVLVVNLAPRKLRGVESNGMILAASVGEKGSPVLAGFLEDVPVGAKLK
jgi:methionyl-tRNA synthetase